MRTGQCLLKPDKDKLGNASNQMLNLRVTFLVPSHDLPDSTVRIWILSDLIGQIIEHVFVLRLKLSSDSDPVIQFFHSGDHFDITTLGIFQYLHLLLQLLNLNQRRSTGVDRTYKLVRLPNRTRLFQ